MKKLKIIKIPEENYYKGLGIAVGDTFDKWEFKFLEKYINHYTVWYAEQHKYYGINFLIPIDCCEEVVIDDYVAEMLKKIEEDKTFKVNPLPKACYGDLESRNPNQLELPLDTSIKPTRLSAIMEEEFRKNDEDKPQFSNLPQLALLDVVKAFDYGQKKYNKFNYSKGTEYLRYYDACQRHLSAWIRGEDIDESGNSHLSHSIASLMMLLDVINTGKGVDNRNKEYKTK